MRRTRGGIAYVDRRHGRPAAAAPARPRAPPARCGRRLLSAVPGRLAGSVGRARTCAGTGCRSPRRPTATPSTPRTWRSWPPSWAPTRVTVLGHSFGGVIGAVLGSGWYGVTVDRVVGLGVKIDWTDDEVTPAQAMAVRPAAGVRHAPPRPPSGTSSWPACATWSIPPIRSRGPACAWCDGGWVAALDPRAFGAVGPPVRRSCRAARRRCGWPRARRTRWSGSMPCAGSIRTPSCSTAPATTPTGRPPRRSGSLLT